MITVSYRLFVSILLFSLAVLTLNAQPRRPMTPADILRVPAVSDVQISPNGSWVVYTVSTVADDKTINSLWLARAGTESVPFTITPQQPTRRNVPYVDWPELRTAPTPLLPTDWNASTPRWSPDSTTIAFLSDHDEQNGLWTVKLDRREPRFVTSIQSTNFFITYSGESYSWAPDSKRIAYISATPEMPEPA